MPSADLPSADLPPADLPPAGGGAVAPAESGGSAQPMDLAARLVAFCGALRTHGVAVGTSEVVDAGAVISALGLERRDRLREGLAAALMRRAGQRSVFDQLFEVYFPAAVGDRFSPAAAGDRSQPPAVERAGLDPRSRAALIRHELTRALAENDDHTLDRLAARALDELGRLGNSATLGGWSAQQALDALNPQTAIVGALAIARAVDETGTLDGGSAGIGTRGQRAGASGAGPAGIRPERLSDRYDRDEIRRRVAAFRRRVETEARRRNAEVRGQERIARYAVRAPLERRPFTLASPEEFAELRHTLGPLARRLAARVAARRRRAARGQIDIRRTLRSSMSTGGVPMKPAFQRRHPGKPDLVLLCDLSSSVANFSGFTMLLMQALSAQFRRVRVFGFVNICDDITPIIAAAGQAQDVRKLVAQEARVAAFHGNSDYGTAFADFVDRYLSAVGPRSSVIVLGDARSNGTDPQLDAFREIVGRARHAVWLNPEPETSWGTGDSAAPLYARIADMHECRNLEQLRQFVTRNLPI
ncbi:MAG TPA: VWA domain-containing protein [Dermatophilaceae bacterium]|nr:VWA domain-containing protein [Dermatophilaceae bacterium]